jgi:hypothetical protein
MMGADMARESGKGAGMDPVTKVFVIFAFIGSLVYIACMLNDSVNSLVNDTIGINIQGQ